MYSINSGAGREFMSWQVEHVIGIKRWAAKLKLLLLRHLPAVHSAVHSDVHSAVQVVLENVCDREGMAERKTVLVFHLWW